MNKAITVSQLNTYIKSLLDGADTLRHLYITGEISNLTIHYKSGHMYLSLKDDRSAVKAVMFATAAKRLRFTPKDGMKILARGRVAVYEATGQYQVYIEDIQPDGLGALNLAYEQLKERLAGEGLFSQEYKKEIPAFPSKIAVITSPTGAAVQDMFKILARRWPVAEVIFAPCTVQGEKAVPELLRALALVQTSKPDVILIGRGGGSLEDIWAFNDEKLARAVFACACPIVSAVGHETDFTICDFVSDLRASTPSAAAELVTPDIYEVTGALVGVNRRLKTAVLQKYRDRVQQLDRLPSLAVLRDRFLVLRRTQLQSKVQSLALFSQKRLSSVREELGALGGKLDALSPLKVLARGYAQLSRKGAHLASVDTVEKGDVLEVRLTDGNLSVTVNTIRRNNHAKKTEL